MLKLKYFGHLMRNADSWEKTLMLGKIESKKRAAEDEMVGWHHRLNGHAAKLPQSCPTLRDPIDMSLSKIREIVEDRGG